MIDGPPLRPSLPAMPPSDEYVSGLRLDDTPIGPLIASTLPGLASMRCGFVSWMTYLMYSRALNSVRQMRPLVSQGPARSELRKAPRFLALGFLLTGASSRMFCSSVLRSSDISA